MTQRFWTVDGYLTYDQYIERLMEATGLTRAQCVRLVTRREPVPSPIALDDTAPYRLPRKTG